MRPQRRPWTRSPRESCTAVTPREKSPIYQEGGREGLRIAHGWCEIMERTKGTPRFWPKSRKDRAAIS